MLKQFLSTLSLLLFIPFLSYNISYGQKAIKSFAFDTSKTYRIQLFDETEFIAMYLTSDSISIVIKTNSIPKIEIPINKIKSIELVESILINNGIYWFSNPNPTRYLFAPSAFNLKKGEGYYQNTYIFLNSFSVGITDNFSFGGGIELYSTFSGNEPIFFLTPKFGFKINENLHIGGGLIFASIPSFGSEYDDRTSVGLIYGISTFGGVDKNFSTGLGWGFINGDFSTNPFITLSGLIRISRKTAFVTENWIIPSDGYTGIFSYGIRFFGEKLSVDLAFLNNQAIARGLAIGIPYVDFVVKF
ncbi:MAG TPA: hypothetical protein VK590_14735 [Saprospiraceae bacterium]|nr:hypothetical protein [Saprospiraceae bacterium]